MRRRRRVLALLLTLVLITAACGGGGDDGASEGDEGGSAPSEETSDIDPDGVLRVAYDIAGAAKGGLTWDPTEVTTQLTDSGLFYYVYGLLLRPTSSGELIPDLAEEVTIVDETTIEITLREGLAFSDGVPFDAEVVKAGLERNLAATDSVGYGTAFFDLETVEVTSPTTLTLGIPNGTAAAWHDTFLGSWETTITRADTDFSNPIGAGPMVVKRFQPGQSIVLEKNPSYWDAESILLGGIEYVQSPDAESNSSALGAEQVDMTMLEPRLIPALQGDHDVLIEPNPNTLGTFMTCKRDEPLSDPKVRLAMNKAIDRDAINEAVYDGAYEPAAGLWPEGHRFHNPEVSESIAYDPEGAKELLDEAGYGDGFEVEIYVLEASGLPEVTQIIQQQYAEVGIKVKLVPSVNYVPEFLVAQKPGLGAVPTMSPNRLKLLQWIGESIGNTCFYKDPDLEALQTELNAVSDASDEAVEIWHRIEQKVVAEDALSIFLFFGSAVVGFDPDVVDGVAVMPYTILAPDLRSVYIKN